MDEQVVDEKCRNILSDIIDEAAEILSYSKRAYAEGHILATDYVARLKQLSNIALNVRTSARLDRFVPTFPDCKRELSKEETV